MTKVLNKNDASIEVFAKSGDSIMIPVGISNIPESFCVNLPPSINIINNKENKNNFVENKKVKINTKLNNIIIEVGENNDRKSRKNK